MSGIPSQDWTWINAVATRFEAAWKAGLRPQIEGFLADVAEPQRVPLLTELLLVERELRIAAGELPTADEYCRRFPEHHTAVAAAFDRDPSAPSQAGRASILSSTPTLNHSPENAADPMLAELANHPDYEIIRELGRGGMGVVYLAHNKIMGRDEVLKTLDEGVIEQPAMRDRFQREIRAVASLRHPNIVAAYSAFRSGETLVFAMEYVEGLDLARMVKAKGPMPVGHACYFVYQAALAAARP